MESKFAVQLTMKRLKLLLNDGRACYREEIPAELSTLDHWFSKREDITKDPEFFLMFGNSCLAKSDFSTALTYAEKGLAEVTTLIQDSVSTKGQESKRVLALEKLKEDLTDLKHGAQLKIPKQEKGSILTVRPEPTVWKGAELRSQNSAQPDTVYPLTYSGRNVWKTFCTRDLPPGTIIAKEKQCAVRFPAQSGHGQKVCHQCLRRIHDFVKPCLTCPMALFCSNDCYNRAMTYHG